MYPLVVSTTKELILQHCQGHKYFDIMGYIISTYSLILLPFHKDRYLSYVFSFFNMHVLFLHYINYLHYQICFFTYFLDFLIIWIIQCKIVSCLLLQMYRIYTKLKSLILSRKIYLLLLIYCINNIIKIKLIFLSEIN